MRRNALKRARKKYWTGRERGAVLARIGRFSTLSGFVAALVLPGGIALLPVLAWWLRHKRPAREGEARRSRRPRRWAAAPDAAAAPTGGSAEPSTRNP